MGAGGQRAAGAEKSSPAAKEVLFYEKM